MAMSREVHVTDFVEKLRLREKAEEDRYFAQRDRELIAARRWRRRLAALRSGGQTGVDRGALDAALAMGAATGLVVRGWCPRGRLAEDGVVPARYPLTETPDADSSQRTEWNVRDADATLVLCRGMPAGGTAATVAAARRLGRPLLLLDPAARDAAARIRAWLAEQNVQELNVAGPRESQAPGIGAQVERLLREVLAAAARAPAAAREHRG
jgi:hypothetical protein